VTSGVESLDQMSDLLIFVKIRGEMREMFECHSQLKPWTRHLIYSRWKSARQNSKSRLAKNREPETIAIAMHCNLKSLWVLITVLHQPRIATLPQPPLHSAITISSQMWVF